MVKRFCHLIYVPISGVGIGIRDNKWLQYRIEIFKKYTLNSLLNQTEKLFIIWLSFRQEDRDNPLIAQLISHLNELKINYICTFDGLMYHDDKFSKGIKNRVKNFARLIRQCYRLKTFKGFTKHAREMIKDKNSDLKARLAKSLDIIKNQLWGVDWVYVTRIDSDDMFHKEVIKEIQSIPREPGALVFEKGYVYNSNTQELAEWHPKTNPPFHTIIFEAKDFFDPWRYLAWMKDFKSHEDITRIFKCTKLKDGGYCVLVHNQANQISTIFDHPFTKERINGTKKEEILKDFGIG